METLDFSDVAPRETAVTKLLGRDYVLREAKGDAVLRYQQEELGSWENVYDDVLGKRTSKRVKPAYKLESLLVSLCLFDAEGKPVPQATVETFPPNVQRTLYVAAMAMTFPDEDVASLKRRREAIDRELARLEAHAKNGQAAAT